MNDVSRLNKMLNYSSGEGTLSLAQGLVIGTRRHGGDYYAVLIHNEDAFSEVRDRFAEDWGWECFLKRRDWYPFRTGRTAEEALGKLLDFLNNTLTHDRQKLINWSSNCSMLEQEIIKGDEGNYDLCNIPNNWITSLAEAY